MLHERAARTITELTQAKADRTRSLLIPNVTSNVFNSNVPGLRIISISKVGGGSLG